MNNLSSSKKTVLHLTGGLGNELFQISAGLYSRHNEGISIEWVLGSPRINKNKFPQIECYELPSKIELLDRTPDSYLARKSLGYLLRSGIAPKGLEKNNFYRKITKIAGSILIGLKYRKLRWIFASDNVGYTDIKISKNAYLVGYFQSFKYSEDQETIATLRNLKAKNFPNIELYKNLAKEEAPLVVHVRLADYYQEEKFGVLSYNYYEKAIKQCWETGLYNKIWLFSDEPDKALNWLPLEHRKNVRIFGDIEDCIVKTLEVMRLGHGYVIANSTFSWWGARLSHTDNPQVVAPQPWFIGNPEPKQLIPPKWKRVEGW